MGQYYNILTFKNNKFKIYDRSVKQTENGKSEYMLAKLTEHSWIGNSTMVSFSNLIYKNPTKLAWVGDYADETKNNDITNPSLDLKTIKNLHEKAWKTKRELSLIYKQFNTESMLLVNWDKKLFVNMKEYIKQNDVNGWCLHPLSLLTAIGNGFGGGDYYSINKEEIGTWAFDTISFEDKEQEESLLEQNFEKAHYEFKENY